MLYCLGNDGKKEVRPSRPTECLSHNLTLPPAQPLQIFPILGWLSPQVWNPQRQSQLYISKGTRKDRPRWQKRTPERSPTNLTDHGLLTQPLCHRSCGTRGSGRVLRSVGAAVSSLTHSFRDAVQFMCYKMAPMGSVSEKTDLFHKTIAELDNEMMNNHKFLHLKEVLIWSNA